MHSRPQSHSAERTTGSRDENRKYRVLFVRVQWMQRNIPKRVMYVQTKLSGSAHYLRLRFLGQIQKRIMNPWNPQAMWILRIKSKSAFVSFTVCSFFGKGFGQRIFDKRYGTQQMRYMYNILPEPMLVAPRLWAISYISFHVFNLFTFVYCF